MTAARLDITPGQRVLVDTAPLGRPGPHWCVVVEVSDMALVPITVRLPGGGIGKYSYDEIMDLR